MGFARLAGLLVVAALGACIDADVVRCADGTICPGGRACSPYGCVEPEQLEACDPPPTDDVCVLPGGAAGGCFDGVCLPVGCGNGIPEPGERCDDGNTDSGDGCSERCDSDERCGNGIRDDLLSEACDCGDAELAEALRPAQCEGQPNSDAAGSRCTADCAILGCGDGVVGGLEQCDGADLPSTLCADAGFYEGSLGCLDSCVYDLSGCTGYCGDQVRNGVPGGDVEACDHLDLGGVDCTAFAYYVPDGLACNPVCGFDTGACVGFCGDGVYDDGHEACEPGETEAELAARGWDCTDFGFHGAPGLACGDTCQLDPSMCSGGTCGDGIVQPAEDCDGDANLGGADCGDFGYYVDAGLACRADCGYDFAGCSQRCGDGLLDAPELCDGAVPAGTDCTDFGFHVSTGLACNAACGFTTTGCSERCGDGAINGPEQCDGSQLGGLDCLDFGYYEAGGLTCNAGCTLELGDCDGGTCGDDVVDPAEDCEPASGVGTLDCTDFGFYEAPGLGCSAACNFDRASCREECGDGAVNGPEICDGAPPATFACAEVGWDAGQLSCSGGCYETFEHCRKIGFEREYPGAPFSYLDGVWGIGDELFAVGASGRIVHTSGGAWAPMSSGTTSTNFRDVWGSASDDVFAVGDYAIRHFDGTTWSLMTPPPTGSEYLVAVWGSGPLDVWAVGFSGVVLHYNGVWTKVTTTIPGTSNLNGVWGTGPNNVYVVGSQGVIYRWNGSTWNNQSVASTHTLQGIWGRSATEIYAVTSAGTLWTSNGSTWTSSTIGCGSVHHGIGGLRGGPLYTVGVSASTNEGYICQLAGGRWHRVDDGTISDLTAVGGSDRRLAVLAPELILTTTGASWLPIPQPSMLTSRGAWGTSASHLYVVGKETTTREGILGWNGTTWAVQTVTGGNFELQDVWGGSGWAVAAGYGGRILSSPTGQIGSTWSAQTSTVTVDLNGVWGDATNIFVVGRGGTIVQRATGGTTWTSQLMPGTPRDLTAVWGFSGGPVFAVGAEGTILRRTGGTWSAMTSGTSRYLSGVWGTSASDVYAAGDRVLLHFDGTSWSSIAVGEAGLSRVWGASGDLLVGGGYSLFSYSGGRVLPVVLDLPQFIILDIVGVGDLTYFLSDNFSGAVLALGGRLFQPETTEICDGAWDDDGDGLTDCADPQCAASAACAGSGGCRPIETLACGGVVTGTTAEGATRWPYYGAGCAARDEGGPEAFYRVRRASAGTIQLTLTAPGTNLDLIVSSTTAGGACTPDESCLAAAQTNGSGESLAFAAAASTDYVVIVDGYAGASGGFTLQVTCP